MRSMLSANRRNVSRFPTAIVLIEFSSKHRLILLQEHFEKAWRQYTTSVLVMRARVLLKGHCIQFGVV